MSDVTDPEYSPAEIEFLQCLLDRYSSTGNLVRADDNPAFMSIVRRHYGEPLAERTTRQAKRIADLEAALKNICNAIQRQDNLASPLEKAEAALKDTQP